MAKKRKAKPNVKRASSKAKKPKAKKGQVRARAKKPAAKTARRGAAKGPAETLEKIGEVTHYFPQVKAAAVKILKDGLKVGDTVYIKGHTTDFKETVKSMQLDHVPIQAGNKGDEIGLLVKSRVRIGDSVYRV